MTDRLPGQLKRLFSCNIRRKTFRYMVAEKLIGNKIRPRTVIMKLYIESVMNESLRDREVSLCVVLRIKKCSLSVKSFVRVIVRHVRHQI